MTNWIGIDVGGRRKGFDAAVVHDDGPVELHGRLGLADVVAIVEAAAPRIVAIDSPRVCARAGQRSREGEQQVARSVCGIRWTPVQARGRN